MHTLHTRAATIFSSWAEEEKQRMAEQQQQSEIQKQVGDNEIQDGGTGESGSVSMATTTTVAIDAQASSLWRKCWCPLLQGEIYFQVNRYVKVA